MRECETIIVGGGPAGSSFARELLSHGRECLVLEKRPMPRPKLCAGWITPKVVRDLEIGPGEYPHGMVKLKRLRLRFGRSRRWALTVRAEQYSVRRIEFDAWLLARSKAEVVAHAVRRVRRESGAFVLDGEFRCRHLVGAGGTACPVRRALFPERNGRLVVTREVEFAGAGRPECTLWFPFAGPSGYAWYVPKAGAVNIGFGGLAGQVPNCGFGALWRQFAALIRAEGCIEGRLPEPKGHPYYLGDRRGQLAREGAYLVGDAAGLATWDLAEGIGPAVESGILGARDLLGLDTYSAARITRHSLPWPARLMRKLLAMAP